MAAVVPAEGKRKATSLLTIEGKAGLHSVSLGEADLPNTLHRNNVKQAQGYNFVG